MMPDDDCVLETIGFLATLSMRFNELRITASKHPAVRTTSVSVLPVKGQRTGDYADNGVVVSVAVNLELVAPKDRDKRALGASLLFRRSLGVWLAEAEVGWTGSRVGWDVIESREAQAGQFALLAPNVPELFEWLSARLQAQLASLA